MIRRLLRCLFPGYASGGEIPTYRPRQGEQLVRLSPGGPDYARIARLEQELGIGDWEPERPMHVASTVCLTKDCDGDTDEIRTWSGVLVARIHRCD